MTSLPARRILITVIVALSGILLLHSFFRHGYDALLVLADLARVDLPLADRRPNVLRQDISYRANGRQHAADLYVPGGGASAGLVLVPGAAADGRNDVRLVEFATALTRSGFAVMVPDIQSLRQLEPSPDSAQEIGDAFAFLRDKKGLVASGWLGISAFSIAVGPAVLAALDPAINEQVEFLLLVGGYHDLVRTLTYLTTGYYQVDGQPQYRDPNAYGKWVYAMHNISRLQDPSDREALSAMVRRKLDNPAAPVDDLRTQLSAAGEAVYEFITNTDPEKVAALMENLPTAVRADIAALNLAAYDLSGLRAEVILVHGRDDDIIPYTESISLASALPPGQVILFLLDGLHHVDRDFHGLDMWRMWRVMQTLLSQDSDSFSGI
jgi:pimeloyl-ACP methyl ester carboxylesterase